MASSALVLEDSATQMRIVSNMLAKAGWTAIPALDLATALSLAERTPVALMLLDVYVGQDSSLAHLDRFRAAAPGTPIAIMTAGRPGQATAKETIAAARRAKVEHLLAKPFAAAELEAILADAAGPRRAPEAEGLGAPRPRPWSGRAGGWMSLAWSS